MHKTVSNVYSVLYTALTKAYGISSNHVNLLLIQLYMQLLKVHLPSTINTLLCSHYVTTSVLAWPVPLSLHLVANTNHHITHLVGWVHQLPTHVIACDTCLQPQCLHRVTRTVVHLHTASVTFTQDCCSHTRQLLQPVGIGCVELWLVAMETIHSCTSQHERGLCNSDCGG